MTAETGAAFFQRVKADRKVVRTSLCLNSQLLEEWEAAQAEYQSCLIKDAAAPNRQASAARKASRATQKAKAKRDALDERIKAEQAWFEFRQMPSERMQHLKDLNPPRKDNQIDLLVGHDRDAVAAASVRESLVSPVFEDCTRDGCTHDPEKEEVPCNSWQQLLVILNPSEWAELVESAQEANGAVRDAPKSEPESTSRSRLAGGSARRSASV